MGTRPTTAAGPGLAGKRVLVTRARRQARPMVRLLEQRGAHAVLCPTIETVPPADTAPLDHALDRLADYDCLIVTSANTARFLQRRMEAAGVAPDRFAGLRVVAIGPATAKAVRALGLRIDTVPESYVAESVFEALGPDSVRGRRFLLPRAAEARNVLPDAIRAEGGTIDVVIAYATRVPLGAAGVWARAAAAGPLDAATFTSSSTARHFVEIVGGPARAKELLGGVVVACIGPIAAATAREAGLEVSVVAEEYTVPGLVEALTRAFSR